MQNVLLVHGLGGNPTENWNNWLKVELEKKDCNVVVPSFPNPETPKWSEWFEKLQEHKDILNKDLIVVGHSLGVPFLLSVIQEYKIKSAFLVAGFTGNLGDKYDNLLESFSLRDFDFEKIRQNCSKFFLYQSDNDPYIPMKIGEKLANDLESDLILVGDAGHFNSKSGYDIFDLLLNNILDDI